jgi:hypothetical protein
MDMGSHFEMMVWYLAPDEPDSRTLSIRASSSM